MIELNIIVPLDRYGKNEETKLKQALKSAESIKDGGDISMTFVGPSEVVSKMKALHDKLNLSIRCEIVENNEKTDIFSQINIAVQNCADRYFTVLEYDDAFSSNWLKSFEPFMKVHNEASIFLPIVEIHDADNKNAYFANEMGWNPSYITDKLGYLTADAIKAYPNFIFSGAIIKTDDFLAVHGLKSSMKIAAWYEFALRMFNNKKVIYVVPKIGYVHNIGNPNSYDEKMRKEITQEEGQWLIKTAEEESCFEQDRGLHFEETSEK